jgi:hypothetical protein
MMKHEGGDELEEDESVVEEPVERPSLNERLMGVTTMEDLAGPYSDTAARGLIERLTGADQRPPAPEKRPPAGPTRSLKNLRKRRGLAARLKIEIPTGLRWTDPVPMVEEPLSSAADTATAGEGQVAAAADPPPVSSGRLTTENLPPPGEERLAAEKDSVIPPQEERASVRDLRSELESLRQLMQERPEAVRPPQPAIAPAQTSEESPPSVETAPAMQAPASDVETPVNETFKPTETAWWPNGTKLPVAGEMRALPVVDGPGPLEASLDEANRFISLRYNALLGSLVFVFGLAVVSGIAMVAALVANAEWQVLAVTGGLVGLGVVALIALLLFLQYEPSIQAAPTATEMAQLETARTYLNKSFEFWEQYLSPREDGRPVTAEDVAMAVSSLTAASHSLLDLETGLAKLTTKPKETPVQQQTTSASSPTRSTPVRSRPSRY